MPPLMRIEQMFKRDFFSPAFSHTQRETSNDLRGSEPHHLSCEAAQGPQACPRPPFLPPPGSDLSAVNRTRCALLL